MGEVRDEIEPTNFVGEGTVDLYGGVIPTRADGSDGQTNDDGSENADEQGGPESGADKAEKGATPGGEGVGKENGAGGVEHGIGGSEIVTAASGDDEEEKRYEVHPSKGAKGFALFGEEIKIQAGKPEGRGEKSLHKLIGEKGGGEAGGDVALMEEMEEVEGNEMVAGLPDKIGEEDEKRNGETEPEPFGAKETAGVGEENCGDNAAGEKEHGVFGHHAETDGGTNGEKPARVVGGEETSEEISGEDPEKIIEGRVLHERAKAEAEGGGGEGGEDLGFAIAAQMLGHFGGKENGDGLEYGGEEAQSDD